LESDSRVSTTTTADQLAGRVLQKGTSMRLKTTAAVGILAAGSLLLAAACSSSSGTASSTTSAAASSAGSSAASSAAATTGKIGVILPDTKSSARWETQDRPNLEAAFTKAGVQFDIQNANGDKAAMATIADQMIANGVTVLAIVNLDNESGAAIEKKAAAQGVQTIDYDRLTLGGGADYYVSFDNTKVGELQGAGLAKCLGSGDKNIVYVNGSPSDSNATLFAAGAHSVLDPMTNYKVVAEQPIPDWDNQVGGTTYEQMYTAQGGNIQGVLAANDGLGNAVIAINKKNGVQIPVTGQDATVQGLQNILAGDQCMTVFKDTSKEAGGLAEVAIALANGQTPTTTGTVKDTTGNRDVAAILETPQAIDKTNVKDVVDAKGVTAAELCTGAYAAMCTAAGIS
jgi:D-xylose transport system substrate-binding protein